MASLPPIRVFIAEAAPAIRQRICALLDTAGMRVVGEASTVPACVAGIRATCPDVVVLEVRLEDGSGLQVLRSVRAVMPSVAFVVFSNHSTPEYRRRYLANGAAQFLDKTAEFDVLERALASAVQPPPT